MKQAIRHAWPVIGLLCIGPAHAQGDECSGATVITCGQSVSGNTSGFDDDNAPFCGTGNGTGGGVWFRFTGNGQSVTASLCSSNFDTSIRVYSGSCNSLNCVAGNNDACGTRSQVTWMSQAGVTYRILVHGFGSATGSFTLTMNCIPITPLCYASTATVYAADPFSGTALNLTDDQHSPVVPLGFTFCFNGSTYTHCVISSNNYISFNQGLAGTWSPWVTQPMPDNAVSTLHSSIMAPWQDIDPSMGGQIRYQTLGTAPNRRFVVSYLNVPMYSCTTQVYTSQTILYESSNCIGTFITQKPVCTTWNSGRAVHGLQNGNGSHATVVNGRNNSTWTASMQGMYFTPLCAPCSTATSGQCMPMVLPVELLEFKGWPEAGRTMLSWATASEHGSKEFVVERSLDLATFEAIATVPAAEQSTTRMDYAATDETPAIGMAYYRLRMVDLDGSKRFSDLIAVEHRSDQQRLRIHPNPSSGTIHVELPRSDEPITRLTLRDMSGREVRSLALDGAPASVTLQDLDPGTYLLEAPELGKPGTAIFHVL